MVRMYVDCLDIANQTRYPSPKLKKRRQMEVLLNEREMMSYSAGGKAAFILAFPTVDVVGVEK